MQRVLETYSKRHLYLEFKSLSQGKLADKNIIRGFVKDFLTSYYFSITDKYHKPEAAVVIINY